MELYPVRRGRRRPPEPWWRRRSVIAVAASALAVLLISTLAFVVLRPDPAEQALQPDPTGSTSSTPTATASPTSSPTPSPTPTPTPTSAPPVAPPPAVVTERPPAAELPPPPPPPPPPVDPSCVRNDDDAPVEDVRAALAAAGAQEYWQGVQAPAGWPGGAYPTITIPSDLMFAIAVTESCWRSTAVGEFGEVGLMQVRSDTASWMNQRFNRGYDLDSIEGNASIGAMYLQWLVMYFGLYYFGTFDLDEAMPIGADGAMVRLADAVIAAYNVGYQNVENLNGTPEDGSDDTIQIGPVGRQYLTKVMNNLAARTWETL